MTILRPALVLFLGLSLLTGVVYPLAVTAVAAVAFPAQAGGSLVLRDGVVVGSSLIGQSFTDPGHFAARPSAVGYDAAASGGSQLGPSHPKLVEDARARMATLGLSQAPVDLVTTSGSGLDPHLSPAGALAQVPRVAAARGMDEAALRALVAAHVEGRTFGVLGEPRVQVLALNLALDEVR